MKSTVIIPTYNGAHKIMAALQSLAAQSHQPDEVIVVIDGSTDGTAEMLGSAAIHLRGFRLIEQKNGGRAQVRNRGAKSAANELLVFLDDDMIAPPGWLAAHVAHHQAHPGSIATGKLEDPNEGKGDDFLQFKSWLNKRWNRLDTNTAQGSAFELNVPYITANNFSIAAGTFQQLEGFDERLTDAEDFDMATRAGLAGIPIFFNRDAWAWHNDVIICRNYVKRVRQYTRAQEVLAELKPELYAKGNQYAASAPKGLKGAVFASLCREWWINSVDQGTWKWLPEEVRYKLYDMIVTANGTFFPGRVPL